MLDNGLCVSRSRKNLCIGDDKRGGGGKMPLYGYNGSFETARKELGMHAIVENLKVVDKVYRHGTNDKGPWEICELTCSTGQDGLATLRCDKQAYDMITPFVDMDCEINIENRGFNLTGQLLTFAEK